MPPPSNPAVLPDSVLSLTTNNPLSATESLPMKMPPPDWSVELFEIVELFTVTVELPPTQIPPPPGVTEDAPVAVLLSRVELLIVTLARVMESLRTQIAPPPPKSTLLLEK